LTATPDGEGATAETAVADLPTAETEGAGADRHEAALTGPDGE
jgi:hypothetical protein